MPKYYYISQFSYRNLARMGKKAGYIRPNAINMQGMSAFLEQLSYSEFIDTRPDFIIKEHAKQLARETMPKWSLQIEKTEARFLTLSDEADENYIKIAFKMGVILSIRIVNPGRINRSSESIVSNVLEAIGIGWLTSNFIPMEIEDDDTANGRIPTIPSEKRFRERNKQSSPIQEDNPYGVYLRRGVGRIATNSRKLHANIKE